MDRNAMGEEPGEGYFASISDLMVGVLFIFLLMMTVLALNYREDTVRLADVISRMERAEQQAHLHEKEAMLLRQQNEQLRARLAQAATALERELQDRETQRANLLQRLATQLGAAGVSFALDEQSGVLHLSDAVPFATGKSDLSDPRALHTVQILANVLAGILPCFSVGDHAGVTCQSTDGPILEAVLVEGHTDSQPYPGMTSAQSEAENDRLSTARALTVFATARQMAPRLDQLRNSSQQPLLGVSGYGQRRPLPDATGTDAAALTRNRRIDIRFVLSSRTSEELRRLIAGIQALQSSQAH